MTDTPTTTEPTEQTPEPIDRSIFLDRMGRFRTQSLFREFEISGYPALFTLGEEDYTDPNTGRTYVSLRRIFVSMEDPSEYRFAMASFASWEHWDRLRNLAWFKPHIESWRVELDARLQSIGTEAIIQSARGEAVNLSVPAARYLTDKPWREKTKPKRGRPSNEEVAGERKRLASELKAIEEDAERIGLRP